MKKNKIIWISGASTGIGKATAIKFVKENWKVAASARDQKKLTDLKKEILNKYGKSKLWIFKCDIRERKQVERTVSNIENKVGKID